jgi:cyclohexa-1,5-dienecarbonyl-CoA hydratase
MATATSTKYERLRLEIQPLVARLQLNNPPLNVIDLRMMDELNAALADVEAQHEVSVLIIRGGGKSFSAGVDVAAHTPDKVSTMLQQFHGAIRRLVASSKISMACVHGHCLGGGAELAMVCDLVYTADDAQWGFPEIQLGCFPPVAVAALSALVGQKRAADLIFTGRSITGTEAAAIGLATEAIPVAQLDSAVEESVARLTVLSPAALAITKKAHYAWDAIHFDKGLARAEKIYLERLMKTEDANEGIRAFMEKRKPEWKGR